MDRGARVISSPPAHAPRTRDDVVRLSRELLAPLERHRSPGGARVIPGGRGARHSEVVQGLEGFARPLWAHASLAAGGHVDAEVWTRIRRGLINGTDPRHPEYWGEPGSHDQRLVEMAAIGFALALVPEHAWVPLDEASRARLAAWLATIHRAAVRENNWLFFRVLVDLGLERVGAAHAPASREAALGRIGRLYQGGGWYADDEGADAALDHYTPWAFQFLGLVYATLGEASEATEQLRERARRLAPSYAAWFDATGRGIPYGRSQAYRFAQGAFFSALAFAGEEALPWGVQKGLLLRHLRYWCTRPMTGPDGVLSAGYGYAEAPVAESYISAASPCWALKAFLCLALPEEHPFWSASEAPFEASSTYTDVGAQAVVCRARSHVVLLPGGRGGAGLVHGAARYGKLAYSSAFGFSVPAGPLGLEQRAPDSELVVSLDGRHYTGRERPTRVDVREGIVRSEWSPLRGVQVTSWVIGCGTYHLRLHRVESESALRTAEGGLRGRIRGRGPCADAGEGACPREGSRRIRRRPRHPGAHAAPRDRRRRG
ncbi:MAG: DUF2264 domain-containing protein [Deltaproteobacteria bacterium]|nr:DUF2264 domain-containing protein [Deltaproteobacteria bacterium]